MQWLYLNGDLVHEDEAAISPLDPAFFHGRALVETFAFRHGGVFRLDAHYDRLRSGAAVLGIAIPITLTQLEDAVESVVERNGGDEARLRLTVTGGPTGAQPNVTLTAAPLTDYPPEMYKRGIRATISDVRRNESSPLSRVKCAAGLLDGILAREKARAKGFEDAIMLNNHGSVAEATSANVFIATHGRILTPAMESGCLPGVTRAAILSLAREEGIPATEIEFSVKELAGADEAFLTNSIMGVLPLTAIDSQRIETGLVTARLSEALHRAESGG